jgi:uncharacterized damage-inducible protein DinB
MDLPATLPTLAVDGHGGLIGRTPPCENRRVADRRTPFVNSNERDTLVAFLDYLRDGLVAKVRGLDEADARRSFVPTGTSVLGLVKHLTFTEVAWFHYAFAGRDVAFPASELSPSDDIGSVVAGYRAVIAISNEITAACDDLGQRSARLATAPEPMSLRWVLVHMIEETARHAGHADILRELTDGEVGR